MLLVILFKGFYEFILRHETYVSMVLEQATWTLFSPFRTLEKCSSRDIICQSSYGLIAVSHSSQGSKLFESRVSRFFKSTMVCRVVFKNCIIRLCFLLNYRCLYYRNIISPCNKILASKGCILVMKQNRARLLSAIILTV